jgi:hypothetical protein
MQTVYIIHQRKTQAGRTTEMPAEFEKRFKEITTDPMLKQKLATIVNEASTEFPCLSCPSKDECNSYKWLTKWFGN